MSMGDDEPLYRWEVTRDQIDLDRWARAIWKTTAAVAEGDKSTSRATRWGSWPVFALLGVAILVVAAPMGLQALLTMFVPFVVVVGGIRGLRHTEPKRVAKRLRAVPAASEPFTFTADLTGTHDTSPSSTSDFAWSRYTAATLDEDLVLLAMDGGAFRVLPAVALTPGQTAPEAVATINAWITEAARR